MKTVPWRVYGARVERARKLTRGRRVRVEFFFSKEDLLLIALAGFPLTPEGLGAFVRDHAVESELRWMRGAVQPWMPTSTAGKSRRNGAGNAAARRSSCGGS